MLRGGGLWSVGLGEKDGKDTYQLWNSLLGQKARGVGRCQDYRTNRVVRSSSMGARNSDQLCDGPMVSFILESEESLIPSTLNHLKSLNGLVSVAYKLELPEELNNVHNTFHVSNLKKCLFDESLVIPMKELRLDDKLNFVEEPSGDNGPRKSSNLNKVVFL
ncbi:hypothetical protein Tco_0727798 [Tanacetum coccineum]|uniref:Tf2-1-like SH3-like domain-containing protein n=1 Tax=Tanacetum coccineum TaxID=301880 RepID=A0ABQ4YLU6_9ASTR